MTKHILLGLKLGMMTIFHICFLSIRMAPKLGVLTTLRRVMILFTAIICGGAVYE